MTYKNILSTDDLKKLAKDLDLKFKFNTGFTYDEIYDLIKNNNGQSYYIFNLLGFSHIDNRIGHYIACIILPANKKILIYTCFGIIAADVVKMFYKFEKYKDYDLVFDLTQHQKINSNSCGWYCLRWLKEFDSTKKMTFFNYISYRLNKYPFKSIDNVDVLDFNVSEDWNPMRYSKYIDTYIKILNEN